MLLTFIILEDTALPYIYHPGPAQAYMSRAPDDDLESYLGDGDWFKIGEYGPKNTTTWVLDGKDPARLAFVRWLLGSSERKGKILIPLADKLHNSRNDPAWKVFAARGAHVSIVRRIWQTAVLRRLCPHQRDRPGWW